MQIRYYEDKLKENKLYKVAVVVCTYVDSPEVYEAVDFMLKCHAYFSYRTIPYDLILIDNNSPYQEWKDRLQYLNHFDRENKGFSFAAYEYGFNLLKDKYDFFLFHEQDIAPCKPHFIEDLFEAFYSEPQVGAVGNCVETNNGERFSLSRQPLYNLCSAFTFSSTAILRECGFKLLYEEGRESGVSNEIYFVQEILEKGYKILGIADEDRTYCNGSACLRGVIHEDKIAESITPLISIHARKHNAVRDYFLTYELN